MDSLPTELKTRILSFFSITEIQFFKQLNSRFRENVERHFRKPTIWDTTKFTTYIFSFLPGNDVYRFRKLNSNCRKAVSKNREYLSLPGAFVSVKAEGKGISVRVKVDNQYYWGNIHLSQTDSVRVTTGDMYSLSAVGIRRMKANRHFFRPIRFDEHTLKEVFDFVLQRVDIYLLNLDGKLRPEFIKALTEAVRDSSAYIYTAKAYLRRRSFDETCELLEEIGKQNMRCQQHLHIEFWDHNGFKKHWNRILKINEISSMFGSNTLLGVSSRQVYPFMDIILEKWSKDPFPHFYLDLLVMASMGGEEPRCLDQFTLTIDDEMTCIRTKCLRTNEVREFKRLEQHSSSLNHSSSELS